MLRHLRARVHRDGPDASTNRLLGHAPAEARPQQAGTTSNKYGASTDPRHSSPDRFVERSLVKEQSVCKTYLCKARRLTPNGANGTQVSTPRHALGGRRVRWIGRVICERLVVVIHLPEQPIRAELDRTEVVLAVGIIVGSKRSKLATAVRISSWRASLSARTPAVITTSPPRSD